ncbi:MAG TPA: signal peptidase I [Victivallales bacterium]|nr:signal peptidase I [Victivallales bacterium]
MTKKMLKSHNIRKEIKLLNKLTRSRLRRDDDILTDKQKKEISDINSKVKKLDVKDSQKVKSELTGLTNRYNKTVPKKNFKIILEYAEIIVVALTVAFGIRALYVQPFKIPTSSMQPTLFGIHYIEKKAIPDLPQPLEFALFSTQRAKAVTEKGGPFEGFFPPYSKFLFFPWSAFDIGGVRYDLPGKPQKVAEYSFLKYKSMPTYFPANTTIANGWLSDGDHLFVNRLIYHFVEPARGDIVVFTTNGLYEDATGQPLTKVGFYYVKRLVGMPGDYMKIVNNMLYIKPKGKNSYKPVTDFNVEAFNRIYSHKGGYQGYTSVGRLAKGKVVHVPPNSYFMMGDNSYWSADSRYWGFVPRQNIVGKALFVFWPFSRRWGMADVQPPVNYPTVIGPNGYIKAMTMQ